jgi:hypothetical protein
VECFQWKLKALNDQQTSIFKVTIFSKSMPKASYPATLSTAKMCKPHSTAENIILPAATENDETCNRV